MTFERPVLGAQQGWGGRPHRRAGILGLLIGVFCCPFVVADDATDFFEAKIRPVLASTCFRCHGGLKAGGTLHVDSRDALLKGGESGPAIVPGNPDESLLIQAIKHQDGVSAMPPEKDKTLRPDQIADFVTWVRAGAAWPEKTAAFEFEQHWAFEPVRDAAPPTVQDSLWPQTSIDHFVLAKQEAAGVRPAARADKLTLIRRVTFDLTGLPPTPDEIDAFLQDSSPKAFDTVIERLLASSAYGERWGRHWLDVVRYADTAGETADYPVRDAWRYRNYVIDSFNADKPYDEFLREQIAGDILAEQGPRERYAERAVGTGFLAISRRFGFDSENYHHLTIQDTIDTLGQSVLGLSLGCARCHDHKFDPVSLQDYYGLYGIFESSSYAFPGAEQKQRSRAMMPLMPPRDARQKWTAFDQRVSELVRKLSAQAPTAPPAILRSLDDLDGDFEMQGPAAGGSKGVLVGPWAWSGDISVTASAQSPFKQVYLLGKLGTNLSKNGNEYHLGRAIHPSRTRENCPTLFVNLEFRIATAPTGQHRVWIGDADQRAVAELWISQDGISVKAGDRFELIGPMKAGEWYSLQLMLDLERRELSGRVQGANEASNIPAQPFAVDWSGSIDYIGLNSVAGAPESKLPVLEIDNLAIQDSPFPTSAPSSAAPSLDLAGLTQQLKQLAGQDGNFESQNVEVAPDIPWTAGPNSVVKIAAAAQSPFQNLFAIGTRGISMPNRAEYDGYGQTLATDWRPEATERLYASVDFCCASDTAGGMGSWRFYLGHGPGVSAAVELFFNGHEVTKRSGDAREVVRPLRVGEWYQLQLSLNLKERTYTGVISSFTDRTEFAGAFATGWDGHIDYTFIDSYGHRPGVRPELHADNFTISETSLSPTNGLPIAAEGSDEERRQRVVEVRAAIKGINDGVESARQELAALFTTGPCDMAYGVVEGTPHNARIQIRGEPDQPGVEVPRGFVKILGGGTLSSEAKGSGRLELAQWITRADNPLTSRVMANRLWQNHFGTGLVKTSNDFGVRGLKPTHPELLDHLAQEFVRGGWSIKNLHRLILRSATYQRAGAVVVAAAQVVHTNASGESHVVSQDLLASFPRRRLSAEEIRDSILAISGELDPTQGTDHPFPPPASWGYSQHGPFNAVYDHDRRSIYLMTQRLKRHPFLGLFDGADPNTTTAIRTSTTVPTQSLFFFNDPFVHTKAGKCAERLRAASPDESVQVERAVRLVLGRLPTADERADAVEFLQVYRTELVAAGQSNIEVQALAAYVRTLFGSNEFLHVD